MAVVKINNYWSQTTAWMQEVERRRKPEPTTQSIKEEMTL